MPRNHRIMPLLAAALAGCAARQAAPFHVSGEAGAVARLAGQWTGSYDSPVLGRSGSIAFTFPDTGSTAHGDVVMMLPGQSTPLSPAPGVTPAGTTAGTAAPAPSGPVLTIDFAQARGDSITGTVTPYLDPDCSCSVRATFTGHIEGDTIRGTFVTTRMVGSQRVQGTWEVRRRR
jgi:hypothetical protein